MPRYYHTPYGWKELPEVKSAIHLPVPKTVWLCGNDEESCYVSALTRQDAEKLVEWRGMKVIGLSKSLN